MHNAYVLLLLIVDIITSREAIFFLNLCSDGIHLLEELVMQ